jgi:hypothetical protein
LMSVRTWVEPDLLTTSLPFAMWLGLCGSLGVGAFLLVAWQHRCPSRGTKNGNSPRY